MLRKLLAWCFRKRERTPRYLRGLSVSQLQHLRRAIERVPGGTIIRDTELRKIAQSKPPEPIYFRGKKIEWAEAGELDWPKD